MKDILEEIIAHKRIEVEGFKAVTPLSKLCSMVEQQASGSTCSMRQSLIASSSGIIAEFKRKSPSKGWINENAQAADIPLAYQQNGASAVSILTDRRYFGGDDSFIAKARQTGVTLPILYKNFIVDEYQLYQAKYCGASAALLIAAALTKDECRQLIAKAHELGLEILLEMHSISELEYADLQPDMCGINNRNLGTFITDVDNSFRLAERLPADACKVSESGIANPDTVRQLREAGFRGFLIGENFMKTADPGNALCDFISKI